MITSFFRLLAGNAEERFYVETSALLNTEELEKLRGLIADPAEPKRVQPVSFYALVDDDSTSIVEIGPRLNFETPDSSNALAICRHIGLTTCVTRLEQAVRYPTDSVAMQQRVIAEHRDLMTQDVYPNGIVSFSLGNYSKIHTIVGHIQNDRLLRENRSHYNQIQKLFCIYNPQKKTKDFQNLLVICES